MPVIMPTSTRELSPTEQLRHGLDAIERDIAAGSASPAAMANIVQRIDDIDQQIKTSPRAIDIRSERSRVEDLRERLVGDAARVARLIQASGQADQFETSATWHLVQAAAAARRRRRQQRLLLGGGVVLVVALLLFVVVPRMFPAPVRADVDTVSRLVGSGDLDTALATAQAEQLRVPNDPQAWLWIGALQQRKGDHAAADQSWANAQRLLGDEATFRGNRALVLIQTGDYAGVEADANVLIQSSDTAAEGYYLLGQAQNGQNKFPEALASLDKAAALADQNGNGALAVAAKLETQNILQRPFVFPTATP